MAARLGRRVDVATCIACGARSRVGDCPIGCSDVALDLVDADDVDAAAARVAGLASRVAAFSAVVEAVATDAGSDDVRERAHNALRIEVPEPSPEPKVIEAWGCPECGRVDAPQPCLDVCIRHPVPMTDAAEYEVVAKQMEALEQSERELARVVRLIAHVTPRRGEEGRSRDALRTAARDVLISLSR
jgi:hypothetical protein